MTENKKFTFRVGSREFEELMEIKRFQIIFSVILKVV